MEDKIFQAREEFNSILEFVTNRAGDLEIHRVEESMFRYLLRLGRLLLEAFISSVGTGRDSDRVVSEKGEEFRYLRDDTRHYFSIFGKVLISPFSNWAEREAQAIQTLNRNSFPIDSKAARSISSVLQDSVLR